MLSTFKKRLVWHVEGADEELERVLEIHEKLLIKTGVLELLLCPDLDGIGKPSLIRSPKLTRVGSS